MRSTLLLTTLVGTFLCTAIAGADPMPPPPAPPAAPTPVTIDVHVESETTADFEHRATADAPWENICITPCDVQVKPGEQYRVLGMDISPSDPFIVDGSSGNKVTLKVKAGSIRKSRTGLWLLGVGGVLGVAGIITLIGGGVLDGFGSNGVISQDRTDALFAGSFMLIGAVGFGLGGFATWANNHVSTVQGPVLPPSGRSPEPLPVPKTAFMFPVLNLQF